MSDAVLITLIIVAGLVAISIIGRKGGKQDVICNESQCKKPPGVQDAKNNPCPPAIPTGKGQQ